MNNLEIRKFRDKYLLCVFSHNKFLICGEMAVLGVSGPQTGSRTAPSGEFPVVLIQWAALKITKDYSSK